MKNRIMSVIAILYSLSGFAGGVCTWNGGSGKWSESSNWREGKAPGNGDSVVIIAEEVPLTVENDIDGLELSGVTVKTNAASSAAVVLTGKKLKLASGGTVFTSECLITNSMPLVFADNGQLNSKPSVMVYANGCAFIGEIEILGRFRVSSPNFYTVSFYGPIHGENGFLYSSGANNYIHFHAPVNVKGVLNEYWCSCQFNFHAAGNTWETNSVSYSCTINAKTANAFPADMVLRGTEKRQTVDESFGYMLNAEQTVDRIESGPFAKKKMLIRDDNAGTVLTLRASASASSYAVLQESVTLVYDPIGGFTQTFCDKSHTTKGKLIVRGGTLESRGVNTFANVTGLEIDSSGRFRVSANGTDEACDPFSLGKTEALIRRGGVLEVCGNVTVSLKSLYVAGVIVPAGLYQKLGGAADGAQKADWVEGDGLVEVLAAEDATCWKAAADGNWNDAANWTDGVPTAGKATYVTAEGGEYTLTIPAGSDIPANLTVGNIEGGGKVKFADGEYKLSTWNWKIRQGGAIEVPAGVKLFCDPGEDKTRTTKVDVSGGGEFIVSGGDIVFTNMYFAVSGFTVHGEGSLTGRVSVKSGLFSYSSAAGGGEFELKDGAELTIDGGIAEFPVLKGAQYDSFKMSGGRINVSSTGVFSKKGGDCALGWTGFKGAEAVFSGCSRFECHKDDKINVSSSGQTDIMRLSFTDSAKWYGCASIVDVRNAVCGFHSDVAHAAADSYIASRVAVGCDHGSAFLNVTAGFLPIGNKGLNVGLSTTKTSASEGVEGAVKITGGAVSIKGYNGYGYDFDRFVGMLIGDGSYTAAAHGHPYVGSLELAGGSLTNVNGCVMIGIGYGRGLFRQTGGVYRLQAAKPFTVGMGGGIGRLEVSGGDFAAVSEKAAFYIGGVGTNVYYTGDMNFCSLPPNLVACGYPVDRHDADGTLSFSGGTMSIPGSVVLGADGRGVLERIGAEGTLMIGGDLIFSNCVENAASGGTLAVRLDAEGNAAPIAVKGRVVINPGSRLVVDTGTVGLDRVRAKALTAAGGVEGSFAEVVFTGANAPYMTARWLQDGTLAIGKRRGTTVVVR